MAEVSQKEAVANSVINPEAVKPVTSGTRTEAEQRGSDIRDKLKNQGARETLTDMLKTDAGQVSIDKTIDGNIAGTFDAAGNKIRTPEAARRFKDANEAADKVYDFLDKGTAMDPAKLAEITDDLRNVIALVPEMDDLLNGLSGTQVEALLQEKLQDPKFREILQEKMKGISGTKIEDDSQAEANRKAQKEAERVRKAKEDEVNGLGGQLKNVTDRLDEYKSGGKARDRLDEIETNLPDLKQKAEDAETALRGIDRRAMTYENQRVMLLDQLNKQYSSSSTDITEKLKTVDEELAKLDKERAEKQKVVTEHQSQLKEQKELKEKETAYQKEQQELQAKQTKASRELSDLTSDANELKGRVALSDRERADLEEKFVRSIEAVFINTSVDYLKGEISAAEAENQKIMEENLAKAKDALEKGVFTELKDGGRWDRTRTVGGLLGKPRTTVEINKDAVNMDYATLLLDGPESLVRGILTEQNPTLTDDEIDEKMNDKDFVDKASETAAKQLLMKRIKSSGKISEPEAYKIATSEWGGKALKAALEDNAAAKKMIEDLNIQGALKGTTPAEWARNNPSAIRLLLSILVGGASLAAGVAVAPIAGAGVLAGGAGGGAAKWYRSWSS